MARDVPARQSPILWKCSPYEQVPAIVSGLLLQHRQGPGTTGRINRQFRRPAKSVAVMHGVHADLRS